MNYAPCNMKYQKQKSSVRLLHTPYSILHRGISLVEVVIGTALILLALAGLVTSYSFYLKAGLKNTDSLKATFLLQEGVEAVTLMRDNGWSTLSSLATGTPYYLAWSGTSWIATSTATTTDGVFLRTFQLDDVYRKSADQDIVASSSPDIKTLDAGTKAVMVRVITASGATTTLDISIRTYLTNLFE